VRLGTFPGFICLTTIGILFPSHRVSSQFISVSAHLTKKIITKKEAFVWQFFTINIVDIYTPPRFVNADCSLQYFIYNESPSEQTNIYKFCEKETYNLSIASGLATKCLVYSFFYLTFVLDLFCLVCDRHFKCPQFTGPASFLPSTFFAFVLGHAGQLLAFAACLFCQPS